MGFGAPLALFALAAVALPVIAHLLRRRDVPVRPLPTIALLRRADVASRRRVRVVDRLLLAARIALVALAAIALAAPFVTTTLAWGDGRVASVAIVIDDSMSMSARDGGGGATRVERAVARAREVIGALPPGSEVAVVLAGEPPRLLAARSEELALARERLDRVRAGSARGTALAGGVELAARQLAGARNPLRRVLVLTDAARHAEAGGLEAPRDAALEVERIGGDEDVANLAVTDAIAAPDPSTPGEVAIAVEVRALGGATDERALLRVRRGEREIGRGEVAIAEGRGRATLRVPMPSGGDPTAEVTLERERPDALPEDDRRGVLLRPVSAPRVLLVDGDPQPLGRRRVGGGGEEVRYLAQALSLAPRDEGGFVQRTVDTDALLGSAQDDVDVIVLANVALRRGSPVVGRVEQHLARGGGLLVTAGEHVEAGAYARLEELLPARVVSSVEGEVVGLARGADADAAWVPAGATGLEAVRATKRLALEPRTGAEVVLAWPDGAPALVVDRARRVAVLGTTIDDEWSDLPYRPGFLPLAVRAVRALAPPGAMPDRPFAPGHAPELRAPRGATELALIGPSGRVLERSGSELARAIDLDDLFDSSAAEAGAWRVQVAIEGGALEEAPRSAFVVAPPLAESDLAPGELPAAREQSAETARGGEVTAGSAARATVRRPLAPWAFAIVGLLAIAEGALRAWRPRRAPAPGARP